MHRSIRNFAGLVEALALVTWTTGVMWNAHKRPIFNGTCTRMANRPLSPHLQIWKWGPHMLTSILHRITGDGMAIVGLGVFLWWLGAMASGAEAYETFQGVMGSPIGLIVLVGLSWAFFTHLSSGLRHFVLDIGAGYELDTNRAWSVASPIIGVVLTVAFWALVLLA